MTAGDVSAVGSAARAWQSEVLDETDHGTILDGDTLIHTDMTYKWFLELLG